MIRVTDHDASFVFASSNSDTEFQVEHELLSLSSDSWTDAQQQPNPTGNWS